MIMKIARKTAPGRKKDNKGFSLIELIIVITIMAILTAILAPQLLRYVEQSRQAKDKTTMDELARAFQLALVASSVDPSGRLFVSPDGSVYNMSKGLADEMGLIFGLPVSARSGYYYQITGIPTLTSQLYRTVAASEGQPAGTQVFVFTRITSGGAAVDWTVQYKNNPAK